MNRFIIALLSALGMLLASAPAYSAEQQNVLYTAPRATGGDCTEPTPCSLYQALLKVQEGQTIYLTGNGEGAEQYEPVAGPARPDVRDWSEPAVITRQPGHMPELSRLSLKQPFITMKNIVMSENDNQDPANDKDESLLYLNPQAHHFTLQDSVIRSTGIFIRSSDTTILRNEINGTTINGEPGEQIDGIQIGNNAERVYIINNDIHDFPYLDPSGYHPDCIQLFDTRKVVIRWNFVDGCGNAGLIISGGTTGAEDILVEGNFFGNYAELRANQTQNLVFVHNTVVSARIKAPTDEQVTSWGQQSTARKGQIISHNKFGYMSYCTDALLNSTVESWNTGLCGTFPSGEVSDGTLLTEVEPVPAFNEWATEHFAGRDKDGDPWVPTIAGWDAPPSNLEPPVIDPPAEPEPPIVDEPTNPPTDEPTLDIPGLNEFYFNWSDAATSFEYYDGTWYMITRTPGIHRG